MSLQQWLGDMPLDEFLTRYYNKLPYSKAAGGRGDAALGSWQSLGRILEQPAVDCMVVRRGEQHDGEPPRSEAEARALCEKGYTVLVRHAERHDERLQALADEFAADFAAPVDLHIYATPGDQYGFGWHYDAEEVFILQTTGQKEYSLRKNTVNPWPLLETIPADMKFERELMPLMKCMLSAGDWLYIPAGYWHVGQARETALSLAVGLRAPAAIDVYDFLRPRLLESMLWRQRLPTTGRAASGDPESRRSAYRELFQQLAGDLQRMLADEKLLEAFLTRQQH